jgi:hypothetical protein
MALKKKIIEKATGEKYASKSMQKKEAMKGKSPVKMKKC